MKKYNRFVLAFTLLLITIAVATQSTLVVAAPAGQVGVLNNGSFEDPYDSGSAQGWARWHQELGPKPENCSDRYAFKPSWSREANSSIVTDGFISQHVGNQFDTWHGGVMQTVAVTQGTTYRFTFWATGRTANDQYPAPSNADVNLGIRAGIDPNGSGLWNDADITWGGSGSPHMSGGTGNWQQFTVEATATGNQMTVFAAANLVGANQCRAHLDVWFDAAQLVEAGPPPTATSPPQPTSPPPPPAPIVTNTPVPPTATATPDVPPTDTPVPTDTPTNTPVPPMGGTICVNAFSDENQNGANDDTEGAMAGVTFVVANLANEVVAQGISSGPSPVCFEELPEGSYQVAQEVPPALEMTTSGNVAISLVEGQQVMIEFGSRLRPAGGETADEVADTTDEAGGDAPANETAPTDTGAIVDSEGGLGSILGTVAGLSVLCLAVVLLGAIVFLLLRQQRASA